MIASIIATIAALVLAVPQHADFEHYTFALTWQPGMCQTDEGCLPDQPKAPLIGLHGLWASLPRDLSSRGVVDRQWWSRGCDYYHHSSEPPALDPALQARIEAVMPHFAHSLLTHEYDKHVQCFGMDPAQFFQDELAMREAVVSSPFGAYLAQQAGHTVQHADVVAHFEHAFSTPHATALQLQCGKNAAGDVVLTQFWITIPSGELSAFPQPPSLMDTPTDQDTCPASFLVPNW